MVYALVFGYFVGSIPIGVLVGLRLGKDIRQYGSGNIGATNALRALGRGPALVVLILDIFKGIAAVLVGSHFAGTPGAAFGGLLAVVGHAFPVWLGFRGGKVAATALGLLLLLYPAGFGIALVVFIVVVLFGRIVSLGSILGALAAAASLLVERPVTPITIAVLGAVVILLVRHRPNIDRLFRKQEPRLGQ